MQNTDKYSVFPLECISFSIWDRQTDENQSEDRAGRHSYSFHVRICLGIYIDTGLYAHARRYICVCVFVLTD